MKKILALILASMLILSLCACTGTPPADTDTPDTSPDSTPDSPPAAEIGGNLLVWLNDEAYAAAIIKAFNAQYPNVNVEFERVDSVSTAEKLSLDGPAGIGPDVIHTGHDTAALAIQDGHVEPFPEDLQARLEESLFETAVNTVKHDGKMYGAPFSLEDVALLYNKDLVDSPPETFEEIIEFAKTYNDPASGKYALRFMPGALPVNYLFLSAFGYKIFGPDGIDWKNPGFDSPEVAQGLAFIKSLREIYDINAADSTWDSIYGAFGRGEVPFVIAAQWALGDARSQGIDFGVTKIPTVGGVQPISFAGSQVACVSSYSKNPDAAFAFAEFMVSVEGAQVLYEILGGLPPLKDTSGVPGLADDAVLMGFAEQTPYTTVIPGIPEMALVWAPTGDMFNLVWDDVLTIEEAQAKAMEDYELLLNASGKSMYD